MAEKQAKTPKAVPQPQEAAAAPTVAELAFPTDLPDAARDVLTKSAQTLKDKTAEAQATLDTATNSYAKIATALVESNVATARNLIAAAFENVSAVLTHVETVAAAKSPADAMQMQVAFAQTFTQSNYDRAIATAEALKAQAADNAKLVQDEVTKLAPTLKSVA